MAEADPSLIAHLFRRAGFGARPAEIAYYAALPYRTAVGDLLAPRPLMGGQKTLTEALSPAVSTTWNLYGRFTPRALADIQVDWINLMATTTTPLVERMTLLLHDHFATGYVPGNTVDTQELTTQNQLFRTHALGNWRTLCHALLEDVALSCWLNNNVNTKDVVNENLARELMELFMVGIDGGYTEHDIREAARALTGYYVNFNVNPLGSRNVMTFDAARHDDADKTIFGRTYNFAPHDVVDLLLGVLPAELGGPDATRQLVASRWVARRLITTFVAPDPAQAFVDRIASVVRGTNWSLRPAMRTILMSSEFKGARQSIVKSPAEFVAGAIRAVGVTDYSTANYFMYLCGQQLFNPPNVGGWVPNEGWLSAGQLLGRYNSAVGITNLSVNQFRFPGQPAPRGNTPEEWAAIFGITELSAATRSALQSYLDQAVAAAVPQANIDQGMITLVISSPEYSLA